MRTWGSGVWSPTLILRGVICTNLQIELCCLFPLLLPIFILYKFIKWKKLATSIHFISKFTLYNLLFFILLNYTKLITECKPLHLKNEFKVFKPKQQVDRILLLGKLDCISVWYQVFVDSIVLKHFWFMVRFI